jgi:hypothetical protein
LDGYSFMAPPMVGCAFLELWESRALRRACSLAEEEICG